VPGCTLLNLVDEVVELREWDAVRVAPATRDTENRDAETLPGFWPG
jgi:hypothetical protein